jgi:lysozyme
VRPIGTGDGAFDFIAASTRGQHRAGQEWQRCLGLVAPASGTGATGIHNSRDLSLSPVWLDFIKWCEGWNGTFDSATGTWVPKNDDAGYPTIGWGHKVKSGETFAAGVTPEQAEEILKKDVAEAQDIVRGLGIPLTQQQFDALVSFVFNIGPDHFLNSTVHRHLIAGLPVTEGDCMLFNKVPHGKALARSPHLEDRRKAEAAIYLNNTYSNPY